MWRICAIAIYLGIFIGRVAPAQPSTTDHGLQVFQLGSRSDFARLQSALKDETRIPPRLPSFMPYMDTKNPIAASIVSASSTGYEIALGWGTDCFAPGFLEGAGACHYGSIEGSNLPLHDVDGRQIPVVLASGVKGFFIGSTCGAHCGDGTILWSRDGCYYSISLKAGSKSELIKMANSAISNRSEARGN